MAYEFNITQSERDYVRELAHKCMDYANLPIMNHRTKLWHAHNSLHGERPMIVMEMESFIQDMMPPMRCESPEAREMEWNLTAMIVNYEQINDDKVIPPYYTVYWDIGYQKFHGLDISKTFAKDSEGRQIGFTQKHPIKDLKEDIHNLKPSVYSVNRERTAARKQFVEEVLGDIMPVVLKNNSLLWFFMPSMCVTDLMGLEAMMYAMVDYPEEIHQLYRFIRDDLIAFVRWQEQEGLLSLNNANDFTGAGSFGFTEELPTSKYSQSGRITTKDLWVNINSQETVSISPAMFGEFTYPYCRDLAEQFGLVYFGCCEPVDKIWEYIKNLPGLRKVSVSPWCNEEFMGNALRSGKVIYSRKPSPNYIGVGTIFDEDAFAEHVAKTLIAAKGCELEFICRDIYTVSGDKGKPGRAVKLMRELIDRSW